MKRMFRKITAFILSFILLSSSLVMPKANAASTSDGDALIGKYINLGSYNGAKVLYRIIGAEDINGDGTKELLLWSDRSIAFKPFDASSDDIGSRGGGTTSVRYTQGSNYWPESNLRDWLNSSGSTVTWTGASPAAVRLNGGWNAYDNEKGFIADGNMTPFERGLIVPFTTKTAISDTDASLKTGGTVKHTYNSTSIVDAIQNYDTTAYYVNSTDNVFILSIKELKLNVSDRGYSLAGKATQQAIDQGNAAAEPADVTVNWDYLIRDAAAGHQSRVRTYSSVDSKITYMEAFSGQLGTRPALYIKSGVALTGSGTGSDPYQPSITIKNNAKGIFPLIKGDKVGQDVDLSVKNWTNPNTVGLRIRTVWNKVEPTDNNYNFAHFNQGFQLAHQNNKLVSISVSVGDDAPQWLYDEGAQGFDLTWSSGEQLKMPLPWDPVYKQKYGELVRYMGALYDSDTALSYVVISGLGRDVETFFTTNQADSDRFALVGGLTAWEQAAKDMIDLYASAFPATPIIFAIGKPTTDAAAIDAANRVVDYGKTTYPNQFGDMSNALNAQSSLTYWINQTIDSNKTAIRTGFQMVSPENNQARMKGTLRQAMDIGVQFGAQFLEIYDMDTDNAANAADLETINQTLLTR